MEGPITAPVPADADPRPGAVPGAATRAWASALERRFHLALLSVAFVDAVFALLFRVPLERFAPTALALVTATLLGGWVIFAPVRRYLRDPEHVRLPARRIAGLARACTLYIATLVAVLAATKFLVLPVLLDFDIASVLDPVERKALPVIHTAYYAALTHFAMTDYAATLRLAIFRRTARRLPAGRRRLAVKVAVAFVTTSLLPLALIASTVGDGPVTHDELLVYLAAVTFGAAVAIWFVARSLLRPVQALEEAVVRVARGDLSTAAPVLSDDETGRLATRFNSMTEGLRERAFIRDTFGKYVPERVARAIVAGRQPLAPRTRVATILYTDIEEFTAIAGSMSPPRVVDMLNDYFSSVITPIEANGGVVNQFQGDAMLVTFNVPLEDPRHADAALKAAAGIRAVCAARTFAGVRLRTRIGIATGEVIAGNVGSGSRLTYTVHGDAVNLAARLEQLNKVLGTDVLVDEATARHATACPELALHGDVAVRGRQRPETLYVLRESAGKVVDAA